MRGEDGEEGGGGIMAEEGGGVIQQVNCLVNLKRLLFRRRNQDIGRRINRGEIRAGGVKTRMNR